MHPITNEHCHNAAEFFDRFSADEDQRMTYVPLILEINYSYSGEMAESYGIFLNNKNKCLYKVHGTECSAWDFNGQFTPELITFDEFEKTLNKTRSSENERQTLLEGLSQNGLSLENIRKLSSSYLSYLDSFDITLDFTEQLKTISRVDFNNLFSSYFVKVEDNLSYYEFSTNYGYEQKFFIDFNVKNHCRLSTDLSPNLSSFATIFVSDLIGSLEIKEDIFASLQNSVSKRIKP